MAIDTGALREEFSALVADKGVLVEEVVAVNAGKYKTLRVIVDLAGDTQDPVSIDLIAEVTRAISEHLGESDLFGAAAYDLEVSSPGATRELREPRHFVRVKGRRLDVRTEEGQILGDLREVAEDGTSIDLEVEGTIRTIALAEVERAQVVLKFR